MVREMVSMRALVCGLWCIGALSLMVASAEAARVALVIGNDSYANVEALKNARADARAMGEALKRAGFAVEVAENLDRAETNRLLRRFRQRIAGGDDVVFFYAGHGVEFAGSNYLLPVDIKAEEEEQIRDDSVSLQGLLDDMRERRPAFTLAIVDACRDNPLKGVGRNVASRGLRPVTVATGQMVIFSAGAGQKALDRLSDEDRSPNGVFTRVFVREMLRGPELVQLTVARVRMEVARLAASVGREQVPALYDQSIGEFYFRLSDPNAPAPGTDVKPPSAAGGARTELSSLEPAKAKEVEDRQFWEERQKSMRLAFEKARALATTAEIAAQAWERFFLAHGADNPYSTEDEQLRREAQSQLAEARARAKVAAPPSTSALKSAYADLQHFRDCEGCPEMVAIPAGAFEMGARPGDRERHHSELPVHRVTMGAFAMGKYEVTQREWHLVMGVTPSHHADCGEDCPVDSVGWEEVQTFIAKLNERVSGRSDGPYRLPSEAEWEYACRGGTTQLYCGSDAVDDVAWYFRNSGGKPHPVGRKQANGFGLYDLSGNAQEWIQDCWNDTHDEAPADGSARNNGRCVRRMFRGGHYGSIANETRASARPYFGAVRDASRGFRLARTLP